MLRFGNLRIRQAQETDVQQLVSWRNDGNIMAHAGFSYGIGTTSEYVSNLLKKTFLVQLSILCLNLFPINW